METKNELKDIIFQCEAETGYPVGKSNLPDLLKACEALALVLIAEFHMHSDLQLVGRGSSGAMIMALIGSYLTPQFEVSLHHVKKRGESSHHDNGQITLDYDEPVIIVDDFMRSGETIDEIIRALGPPSKAELTVGFIDFATDEHISIIRHMPHNITTLIHKEYHFSTIF